MPLQANNEKISSPLRSDKFILELGCLNCPKSGNKYSNLQNLPALKSYIIENEEGVLKKYTFPLPAETPVFLF
jgi:hypothetical protein